MKEKRKANKRNEDRATEENRAQILEIKAFVTRK
jgi:hypothetical protein